MGANIDPKGLKTLSDILALVLQDAPGESAAALEAVRRRARQDGVTGGALKDLFRQINAGSFGRPAPPRSGDRPPPSVDQMRSALSELQQRFVEARLHLDRERRSNAMLRDHLRELEQTHLLALGRTARQKVSGLESEMRRAQELEAQLQQTCLELRDVRAALAAERRNLQVGQAVRRLWLYHSMRVAAILALVIALAADDGAHAHTATMAGKAFSIWL